MEEAEIARIEDTIGYPLTSEYHDFLRRYGDEVRLIKEALTYRAVLWTDADDIVRENQDARKHAAAMSIGEENEPWPENFMVVGTNGAGDYWFIDRGGVKLGVWFFQHECHEVEKHYDSFEAYVAALRHDALNPARWQRPPA